MKRIIAALLLIAAAAVLLCGCQGLEQQEPSEAPNKYPGTYLYSNSTLREISSRTLTVNEDGTYTYSRVSTIAENNGEFTGTWSIDAEGYLILTGDQTGLTSRASLSADTLKLNVADIGHGYDTVGDGIYQYQFPKRSE